MQSELALLGQERTQLSIEHRRLQEEQAAQAGLLASANVLRESLRNTRDQLMRKEEEVESSARSYQRLLKQIEEEEERIRKVR